MANEKAKSAYESEKRKFISKGRMVCPYNMEKYCEFTVICADCPENPKNKKTA